MRRLLRKPPSVYGLLAIGLILIIEPALPQYHFSPFWFSLGVVGTVIGLYDLVRKALVSAKAEPLTPPVVKPL